jgi:hypothetical protein
MRYTVNAPTDTQGKYLGSALTPPLTRTAASWSSRGLVSGFPGTLPIRIGGPEALHPDFGDLVSGGTSYSQSAPDFILPALYREMGDGYGQHEHAPVSRISDNQMPVPAVRPANVLVSNPYRARMGGQRQVYQPQVVQSWRGMRGTTNG